MERYSGYKDSGVKWLGEIPSHWNTLALKYILKNKKKIVGNRATQYELLSLTLKGVIKRDVDNPEGKFPASFNTYQEVEPNDFIFCNFDNEETPRAVGISPYKGMITGAYDVFCLNNKRLNINYLTYYFLYIDDGKRFKPLYKGLRKTIPYDSFMSFKIPVPTYKEQESIANYLDKETSKIDKAIEQQQHMIDLLNERKQIIINKIVTKGLNPNVKMKPSDIGWIGEIPKHWEVRKLKFLLKHITTPSILPNKIGLENIESGTGNFIEGDSEFEGNGVGFIKGDILYGKLRPYLKKVFLAKEEGNAVGDFFVFRPNSIVDGQFIQMLLLTQGLTDEINSSTYGAKMPRVSIDFLKNLYLPLPPIEEQTSIVDGIRKNTIPIEKSIENYRKRISLLQERKQIIINDIVTGKVKIV
jgi:type I restriction enzyme S subunit